MLYWLLSRTHFDPVTDPEQKAASVVYDMVGNIESITTPGERTTSFGYDNNYNRTSVTDPMGYRYAYTYDERGFIISETAVESLAEYAWNGKLEKHDKNSAFAYRTVETDRTFVYDDAGKLLSVTETESGCGTCVYTYEYDLMGNRTAAVVTVQPCLVSAVWDNEFLQRP